MKNKVKSKSYPSSAAETRPEPSPSPTSPKGDSSAVPPNSLVKDVVDSLKTDFTPAAAEEKIVSLMSNFSELQKVWSDAQVEELRAGLSVFTRVDLTPQEREALLFKALQAPLSESCYAALVTLRALIPEGAPQVLANQVEKTFYVNGQLKDALHKSWVAPFLPATPDKMVRSFEVFFEALHRPEIRKELDDALDVVRLLARIEADKLSRIAIDSDRLPHASRLSYEISKEVLDVALKASGIREPIRDLLVGAGSMWKSSLSMATGRDHPQALQQMEVAVAQFERGLETLNNVTGPQDVWRGDNRKTIEEIFDRYQEQWVDTQSPETLRAMKDLAYEMTMLAKYLTCFAKLSGAIANPNMPDDARKMAIQQAVEGMGPIFLKLMQTFVDQRDLIVPVLKHRSQQADKDIALIVSALEQVQTNVTPMTPMEVQTRLSEELRGLGFSFDEVFEAFDQKPMGQGSMGQTHAVTLKESFRQKHGITLPKVCVKIQRPHLKEQFEETEHLLGMALNVVKQSLDIFQNLSAAERTSILNLTNAIGISLAGFIQSFQQELDSRQEAQMMGIFEKDLAIDDFVRVPQVVAPLVSKGLLGMERVDGLSISDVVQRALAAQEAQKRLEKEGRNLFGPDPEAKVLDILEALTGLRFSKSDFSTFERATYGYDIAVSHPSLNEQQPMVGFVRADGEYLPQTVYPTVAKDALSQLTERLLMVCIYQTLVFGRLHGDLHQGNIKVEKNLQSLVLLDIGNVVTFQRPMLKAIGKLVFGIQRRDEQKIAEGLLGVSVEGQVPMDEKAKSEWIQKIRAQLGSVMKIINAPTGLDFAALSSGLAAVLTQSSMSVAPEFLQTQKTMISLYGNVKELVRGGAENNFLPLFLAKTLQKVTEAAVRSTVLRGASRWF